MKTTITDTIQKYSTIISVFFSLVGLGLLILAFRTYNRTPAGSIFIGLAAIIAFYLGYQSYDKVTKPLSKLEEAKKKLADCDAKIDPNIMTLVYPCAAEKNAVDELEKSSS